MSPLAVKVIASLGQRAASSHAARRLLIFALVGIVLVLGTAVLGPLALLTGSRSSQPVSAVTSVGSTCQPADLGQAPGSASVPLDAEQRANVVSIIRISRALRVPEGAIVVALAAVAQESRFRNLTYGDRDSLGYFQQRPSSGWGTAAEIRDPQKSVAAFFGVATHTNNRGLLDLPNWQSMPVGEAAQEVQVSAFPDEYDDEEPLARRLLAEVGGQPVASVNCGAAGALECPASGLPVEEGLQPDALRVLRCVQQRWPRGVTLLGVGQRPGNSTSDHPSGRAVDAVVADYDQPSGRAIGQQIADFVAQNRVALGVTYVIWNSRIFSTARADDGWRPCGPGGAGCYAGPDDTAAHRDHVHVSVHGNLAGGAAAVGTGRVLSPLAGGYTLTAGFAQSGSLWRRSHTGQDLAAAIGTPIRAVTDGQVSYVAWGGAYGRLTKITHAGGVETWYAHQSQQQVAVGQRVTAGQPIGSVGSTGNSTGPHLHLEVRLRGSPTSPRTWLEARGVRL